MKNMKKIMSLFLALVMLVGVALPSVAMAAGEDEQGTTKVYVHKMLMSKDNLGNNKFPGTKGLDETEYDGNQIQNLGAFFGTGSKEIPGVYFVVEKEFEEEDPNSTTTPKAKIKVWKAVTATGTQAQADLSDALGGLTEEKKVGSNTFTALELDTSKLPKGTYRINEIHEKSTYKGENGETLTDMKAVPTEITLPLVNEKGVVTEAHVYPKNTEDKPKIDKNFDKEKNGEVNGITTDDLTTDTKDKSLDINLENNQAEKPKAVKSVGESVPYKVVTEIPTKTKWATAKWDDKMTEGLTYNKDLKIELKKGEETVNLTENTDYKLTQDDKGFVLEFLPAGLKLLNDKAEKQTLTLKYTAKVNDKSVVKVPESNDITFHYGNNPGKGNTPIPNKPDDNGKLKVTKTWADGKWAKNEKAKFKIVDANTGKDVTADDLVGAPAGYTFVNEKEIGYTEGTTKGEATWEYLDKNREYKIIETSVTYTDKNNVVQTLTGWEAEYAVNGKGTTEITDHLTNNPTPLNPSEPKVITYGAKFVKTNADGSERLAGAEFVVRDANNKYLVEGTKATRTEYEAAQKAFVDAIKAYNEAVKKGVISADNKVKIGNVDYEKDADAKAAIKNLEKARDAAWNATLQSMDGFTATDKNAANVLKLTSNELGQFEIAGLKDGTYTLVEVKAPTDYVDATKATLEFGFTIGKDGEQDKKDIDFGIDDDKQADNAMKIVNKKVSIPQTGGIGTVIFTVVGISLMAGAFIAMRKRTAEEN